MANRNNDTLENLVNKGFALEKHLNELIQTQLNRKEFAEYGDLGSELLARRMRSVKENVELLSLQFNFPTKNDMANLARLMVQLEEKLENIEEQLAKLSVSLEQVERRVQKLSLQNGGIDNASPRFKTKEGNVMLSKAPGKDSKVIQMERWLSL